MTPKQLVAAITAKSLDNLATNVSRWPKVEGLSKIHNAAEIAAIQAEMRALALQLVPKDKPPIDMEKK